MPAILYLFATALLHAADPASQIDNIMKQWNQPAKPGASVAVVQHGKLVFSKGYGNATLEYDAPIRPETVFHVASVSKQFTAMALVLLEQQKKLSLEDDIHKYIPELQDYGQRVTIRQLLQHTSGIRDQWQALGLAGWRLDDVITQKQILRLMARQKELNFTPGSEHLYSNGGYTLAAEIVARVSGKSFPDFCQEMIFRPLRMDSTHFHDDHRRIVPNRAYSYAPDGAGYEASPLNYANAGATSLFTTGPDLAKWLDNFREPKVGGRAAIDRLQEQAVLNNGTKIGYALGVSVGKYRGLKTVSHGGADAGYRSFALWLPEQETGIVVLSNLATFNPGAVANQVAEAYFDGRMGPATASPSPARRNAPASAAGNGGDLLSYAGSYWSEELESQYTVRSNGGKLFIDHAKHGEVPMIPAGKDSFRTTSWFMQTVTFLRDKDGRVTSFKAGGGRIRAIIFLRRGP